MTAATITTIPASSMDTLGHHVYSNAMISWALISNNDNDPELLVLFREGGTVYRYSFASWGAARDWDNLRQEDDCEDSEPVSWGRCFNRFLREGDILPITV